LPSTFDAILLDDVHTYAASQPGIVTLATSSICLSVYVNVKQLTDLMPIDKPSVYVNLLLAN